MQDFLVVSFATFAIGVVMSSTMIDTKNLTIKKAHDHLKKGDFSVPELVESYANVAKLKNKEINAYVEVFEDLEEQAEAAQKKFKDGTATLLTGIPLAVKDNILIEGRRASASSKILENYRATYDATVSKKLKNEGVVFLGRTNMDEFAMGGSTENSYYGPTKNPYDTTRVPGGSSGGSAAAVAMGGALAALGSDTGGSIRQPASLCGLVGLKTTYGAVSRYGLMAMASSLDQIGPLTHTIEDAEIIFEAIKGKDNMDSTSVSFPEKELKAKKSYTIAIPYGFLKQGVDKDVMENFEETIKLLKKKGHKIVEIELPYLAYSLAAYYIIVPAEVSSNLARYDGVKYGFLKEGDTMWQDYDF